MRSCIRSPEVTFDLVWRTESVRGLASTVATGRMDVLPILADALEEAGCDLTLLLKHLRADVEHFEGCWLSPLLLQMQFHPDALAPWASIAHRVAWSRPNSGQAFDYKESERGCPGDMPLINLQHLPQSVGELPSLDGPFTLDLRSPNTTTAGLARLTGMRGVHTLALQHSTSASVRWSHLAALPDVRTLYLWGDGVDDGVIAALTDIPQLTGLLLSRTKFTDASARHLHALPGLRELVLREHFDLTDAAADRMTGHPGLEELNVSCVPLTDAGFDRLMDLPALRHLEAFECKVSDTALRGLPQLTRLEVLNLGNSNLTDEGAERIATLSELRSLYAWQTKLTDAGLERLSDLTQLRELYVNHTRITDEGLRVIGRMTGLRHLNLWGTQVTDAGMQHLARLTDLRELDIGSTRVTDAGLEPLRALTRLQSFSARCDGVSDKAKTAFVESFPNCGR